MEDYSVKYSGEDGTWAVLDKNNLAFAWFSNEVNAINYCYYMNHPDGE